jgi:hypothetical protein
MTRTKPTNIEINEATLARFIDRVTLDEDGCWLWTGPPGHDGYGQFMVNYKNLGAHVFSYLAFVADVVEASKDVLHACDKKLCVTPQCLSQDTREENVRQAIERGQFKLGDRRLAQAKLNYDKAEEIRKLYATGKVTYEELARQFNVLSTATVWNVVHNDTWKEEQRR